MEINLIVLNVGNTRLAVAPFVAGEIQEAVRVPVDDLAQCRAAIERAWKQVQGRENAAVAGASVNPPATKALEAVVQEITGSNVQWVGQQLDLPMRVLTDPPDETGVDRVVNMAAAFEQLQHACVVVDAGTAITVSCCNDKGEFLGGAIAPGAGVMLKALHEKTAKLPLVELAMPQGVFGRSTKQAILHGVFNGVRGMVKELVENFATELGQWPELIATGGDAKLMFEGWELVHAISPDLTLYGIALAYVNHHLKQDT